MLVLIAVVPIPANVISRLIKLPSSLELVIHHHNPPKTFLYLALGGGTKPSFKVPRKVAENIMVFEEGPLCIRLPRMFILIHLYGKFSPAELVM